MKSRALFRYRLWPILALLPFPAPLFAQAGAPPNARAVEQASDAFGIRIGVEQIGLYSESQVRGFNLQDSGNYRLNGAYFAKSANLVDPVLAGVVTRVGINALDSDFPAPSGVVDYRLRSPFDAPSLLLEASLREYGSGSLEIGLSGRQRDLAGLVGAQVTSGRSSSGVPTRYQRFAAIGEWRPAPGWSLAGFGSLNYFDLSGFYAVLPTAGQLPPKMRHPRRYVPAWSDHDGVDINAGLVANAQIGRDLEARGSLIFSQLRLDEADHTLLRVDGQGMGRATTISNRPRVNTSRSASAALGWNAGPGHRVFAELRARHTTYEFAPSASVELGALDLDQGVRHDQAPDLPPLPETTDRIDQLTAGIGYEFNSRAVRLKGGIQRTFHDRRLSIPGRVVDGSSETSWLYALSAVAPLSERLTLFASASRGLEESGVAPNQAANRNQVLPSAIAHQQEAGARARLSRDLTLILSLFQISKPAPGFDSENVYRLIGRLRHRGAELSLTGALTPRLRLVGGAVYLDAARSGEPVESGSWSREAVGIPRWQGLAGLTWTVPGMRGLSLDGQAQYSSSRRVNSPGDLRTAALTTADIGFRYQFRLAGRDASLRGRILNLLDADQWVAQRSETLDRPARRGARLSLSVRA